MAVSLNRTNTCFEIGRVNNDLLAAAQGPAGQCSRHNCADPAEREHSIDKQAWLADVALGLRSCELSSQRVYQLLDARSCPDGSGNNRRIRKRCFSELFANLISDKVDSAQVALGERNHGALHTQVIEDLQMLFALRHPAVICGNDKQRQID